MLGFLGVSDVKESARKKKKKESARDTGNLGLILGSPGEANGSPLQYSCLGNPMDMGAC